MQRIFVLVPNIAFHKIVRNYAFELGKPVFTMVDLDTALINYIGYATINN